MVGKKTLLMTGVAMATTLMVSFASAQCNSCSSPYPQQPACSSGCGGAVAGGAGSELHQKWKKFCAEFNLTTARNAAWPQPFKCRDRALYYQIIQTNIDAGWEHAYTLTSTHFDAETNELNTSGESKIAWIMQTAPKHRRSIYIYQDDNDSIDTRIAEVKTVVQKWYSHIGDAQVAATNVMPQGGDGQYFQAINDMYLESRPAPVLNASIGGGVADQ